MNNKTQQFFSNPMLLLKRIGYTALIILLCLYVFKQLAPGKGADFETESALAITIDNTMEASGYIFRSETLISDGGSGTIACIATEGQRVSPGDYVANAYRKSLDLEAGEKIEAIERQIKILEKSNVGATLVVSDISKIDIKTKELFSDICKSIGNNNLTSISDEKDSLLVYLNKRAIASRSVENYDNAIKQLRSEAENIRKSLTGNAIKIVAPCAGYFSGEVDGFEDVFLPETIDKMTVDGFLEFTKAKPDERLISSSAGKVITDFNWYMATAMPADEAGAYEEGRRYTIRFPYSMDKELSMLLYRKINETDKDTCVLVFTSNVMPENFSYSRNQKIELVNSRYTGLKIRKKALRIDKETGKKGVFVLVGDMVEFRLVEEIYEFDDYYLIDMNDKAYAFKEDENQSSKKYTKLKLYDNVVLYGKDLYHGMIIGK